MPFTIINPQGNRVPVVVSVPHCGTQIPDDIRDTYCPKQLQCIDDTDWFVDKLYDFAPQMGITMICAKYSRWVIDLNRDPKGAALYNDGRIITELTPTKNFLGESLYRDQIPDENEIARRLQEYYWPYHNKIRELLEDLHNEFSQVLFFDAHSIRRVVTTIRKDPFPDLILGNQDGKTAKSSLINTVLRVLKDSGYTVQHNDPFKGGTLTRSFGNPDAGTHALQLEMTKINYMDDDELCYDEKRAAKMRQLLQKMFSNLLEEIQK
ncbi:N-formylglutamate amidohydrolase [Candidatus Uabimicrobium amorphum]|uniref:N-formylglutamate deformylase n=1 Tax=Uabimicrobium amorphum TaxID=2596890 RepID=A0A5S9F235_UABAM|nr:N-formylglutamate amidohydrolase [Candidatus Uabimicrobium amorphum]BBM83042.1 N-formylglutamate deformylase [Candidatus Uabimicrobium amorphum]